MQGLQLPQGGGFMGMAQGYSQMGANSYMGQKPRQEQTITAPDKTIGGGLMAGAGMGLAGAQLGPMISASAAAGPWGAAIGAGIGILSYLFS